MAFTGFWMIPLAFLFSLISPIIGFFGNIFGMGQAEVVLPHNPENGVVWEYKAEDEAYIKLADSEIKEGQQIFTFAGIDMFDEKRPPHSNGKVIDDVCFEDGNGNIKRYYVFVDFSTLKNVYFGDLNIMEESECINFEYTVKAKTQVADACWYIEDNEVSDSQYRFIGERVLENAHERTYEFVFGPEHFQDHIFSMVFDYRESPSDPVGIEKIEVTFELINKEVHIVEETYYVRDNNYNLVEVK